MSERTERGFPVWAGRSHRAVPHIARPRLGELDTDVLDHLRPLAALLIARPLVGLGLFVVFAAHGWWPLAVVCGWLIYGSTIAAVHHLIHSGLGLSAGARRFWLTVLGCMVVESGHALQVTHLAHHRRDPDLPDPEGYIENVGWPAMPLAAARFRYRLALWGLRHGNRRRRVAFELAVHAALHLLSLALLPVSPLLWIYLSLIHVASFAFAVFAGKGPQTNWGREIASPLVRVHTRLGRIVWFSHDLHLEHHLYPKVPLPRLRRLRPQLDAVLADHDVVDVKLAA